jgi:hypothetical protein
MLLKGLVRHPRIVASKRKPPILGEALRLHRELDQESFSPLRPTFHHDETLIAMNFGCIHLVSRDAYAQRPITAAFASALTNTLHPGVRLKSHPQACLPKTDR